MDHSSFCSSVPPGSKFTSRYFKEPDGNGHRLMWVVKANNSAGSENKSQWLSSQSPLGQVSGDILSTIKRLYVLYTRSEEQEFFAVGNTLSDLEGNRLVLGRTGIWTYTHRQTGESLIIERPHAWKDTEVVEDSDTPGEFTYAPTPGCGGTPSTEGELGYQPRPQKSPTPWSSLKQESQWPEVVGVGADGDVLLPEEQDETDEEEAVAFESSTDSEMEDDENDEDFKPYLESSALELIEGSRRITRRSVVHNSDKRKRPVLSESDHSSDREPQPDNAGEATSTEPPHPAATTPSSALSEVRVLESD